MLGAIFYKEFFKIRWFWLTLLLGNATLMAYVYVHTRRLFTMDHAEIVWYRVMHLGQLHFDALIYAPLLTGLIIACIQYLPEVIGERLRLSLHLPVLPHRLAMAHVLVGLSAVALIAGLDLAALTLITARYFPAQAVSSAVLTALPWAVAGLAAYLGGALALLEPNYRRKLFNLALATAIAALFLQQEGPDAYRRVLPLLSVAVLLMIPAVLLPAYHFRLRRVS